jgi:dTDP-4-amino-4,6-dideoxygalactose transaminase
MDKIIRLSKSSIGDEEIRAVVSVLKEEFLGMGSYVNNFEDELSNYFQSPALCVVNGTSALQLALQACGIGADDEVLVQSLTYVASFQAISATGAVPVACDVSKETITIDLVDAESKITEKTKAIMPVHYSGGVGDLKSIYDFAKKHNLRVIEDAAHALGSTYNGKKIGSFGDVICFSFDGIKNITSGEGGCIVSKDKLVIEKIKDLRLLGVIKDSDKRAKGERSWEFDVKEQGWRYHMSNIMAAIGSVQLKRFPEFIAKRRSLAKNYELLLTVQDEIITLKNNYDDVVPHIFPIILPKNINRNLLRDNLNELNIQTGLHYFPNHKLSFYRKNIILKNTNELCERIITLPLHIDVSFLDQEYVISQLIKLIKKSE